jgi:DHA1 family multidrug resistance protein-like MFS transporter
VRGRRRAVARRVRHRLGRARSVLGPGVVGLLVVTFLARASQNMAGTTAPLLGRSVLHLGVATIGDDTAVAAVVQVATMALVASRVPPRRALAGLAAGVALLAAGVALLAAADGGSLFLAALVAGGVGGGLTFPSLMTAIGRVGAERRDQRLAFYALALGASLVAGPLAEAAVLDAAGGSLRVAFVAFLPLLVGALAVVGRRALVVAGGGLARSGGGLARSAGGSPAAGEGAGEGAGEDAGEGASTAVADLSEGADDAHLRRAARPVPGASPGSARDVRLLGIGGYRVALVVLLLYQIPFVALVTFGGLLGREAYGLGSTGVQLSFALFFAVSFAIRLAVARRRRVERKILAFRVAAACSAAGLIVLGTGRGVPSLLAGMALLGIPHALTYPLAIALVAEETPGVALGRANAELAASVGVSAVVLPSAIGFLVRASGFRTTFVLLALPVLAFAGLLEAVSRDQRARERRARGREASGRPERGAPSGSARGGR